MYYHEVSAVVKTLPSKTIGGKNNFHGFSTQDGGFQLSPVKFYSPALPPPPIYHHNSSHR